MPYKNIEDKKAWQKRYREANKDQILKNQKEYREKNREKCLEQNRKHQFIYRAKRRKITDAPDYSGGLKYCQDCKTEKPLTDFSLRITKKKYYIQESYYPLCIDCKNKKWKEYAVKGDYYKKHSAYLEKNKDVLREYWHNYYLKNQDAIKLKVKSRYVKKERKKANPKPLLETRWYLKKTKLLNNSILEPEDIPEELMEAYKIYLQLKREVQNVKTSSI